MELSPGIVFDWVWQSNKVILTQTRLNNSGLIDFFRAKVQGFFKDLPGPYFEISRTFLYLKLPPTMCKHRSSLVAQWTCSSNKRALGTKMRVFTHFVRISRILFSVYLNISFQCPSFSSKLKTFQSCSIKNQALLRTTNQFQVLSRPWNQTSEIQG